MSAEEVKSKAMADGYYQPASSSSAPSSSPPSSSAGAGTATPSQAAPAASAAAGAAAAPASASPSPSTADLTSLSDSENLWSYLLKKASRRIRDSTNAATIVVLGDPHQGKTSLLAKLSDRVYASAVSSSSSTDSTAAPPTAAPAAAPTAAAVGHYVYDYSFLLAKNKFSADKEEILAHVNVWTIENVNHMQMLQQALKSSGAASSSSASAASTATTAAGFDVHALDNTLFILCVDLSEPWKVEKSIRRWFGALSSALNTLLAPFPADAERLRVQLCRLVQSYYLNPAPSDWSSFPLKSDVPRENLGVPLLIVGTKGDLFSRYLGGGKAADTEEKFEFLTRRLRRLSVEYGAALIYASALGSKGVNVELLQQYIYHRLLGFPLQPPPAAAAPAAAAAAAAAAASGYSAAPKALASTDGEDFRLFIPHGFDSADLIDSSLPLSARLGWKDDTPLDEAFKAAEKLALKKFAVPATTTAAGSPTAASSDAAAAGAAAVKALDNTAFFNSLKAQLQSAQSMAGAATSSAASALFNNLPSKARAPATTAPADASAKKTAPADGKTAPAAAPATSATKAAPAAAAAAPAPTTPAAKAPSPAASAAVAAAAASTANANLNPKGQIAVKQFFRSLLNNNPPRAADAGSGNRRASQDKGEQTQ